MFDALTHVIVIVFVYVLQRMINDLTVMINYSAAGENFWTYTTYYDDFCVENVVKIIKTTAKSLKHQRNFANSLKHEKKYFISLKT